MTKNAARCIIYSSLSCGLRVCVHLSAIFVAILYLKRYSINACGCVLLLEDAAHHHHTFAFEQPGCGLVIDAVAVCTGAGEKGRNWRTTEP